MALLFTFLAVASSAMFAGVMLAIGVILGGYSKGLPPVGFLDWFAGNSHVIMHAIPIVVVPTLVGLAGSLWLGWSDGLTCALWLAAAGFIGVALGLTAAYYVPSNAAFAARSVPLDKVAARLDRWPLVHNLRIILAFAASALGVWAANR